jgi:hypothetical protein
MSFLAWLESTAYAEWILYGISGWPIMLTAHAFGLAIAVGVIFLMSLRLLGRFTDIPLTSVRELLNLAWIGVAINIFSGLSLFASGATTYVTNIPFIVKITAILIGIAALHYVQRVLKKEATTWASQGIDSKGKALAWFLIIIWFVAVITGRLIAYI